MKNSYFTKFCGITSCKDAINAENAGANALGFVFVEKSKRVIDTKKCQHIINKLSPLTLTVALFANNSAKEIQQVLNNCSIHVLQFHGNESDEFCQQWKRPFWKAVPMADAIDPIEYAKSYPNATAYLIDNYGANKSGGSGMTFNWKKLSQHLDNKWILAGGLTPENIKKAQQQTSIKSFDVSSGIEKSAGVKSNKKNDKIYKKFN